MSKTTPVKIILDHHRARKVDLYCFYFISFIVLLFIGTRDECVGTDTASYVAFFKHPSFLYLNAKTDLLFEYYGRILRLFIGYNKKGFIFFSALLACWGLFFFIYKTSKQKTCSLLLFMIMGTSSIFFFLYLSMMRQSIAICYFLFAVYFLFEYRGTQIQRLILFSIFYIIAILTHGSCLFTMPFILWVKIKPVIDKKIWAVFFLVTYVMAALGLSFVGDILEYIFGFIETDHYSAYANVGFGMIAYKGWFNMNLLPYMLLAAIILFVCPSKRLKDNKIQFALFSVVLNNLFFDNMMWCRLIMYFSLFMIVAIPNVMYDRPKIVKLGTMTFVVFYYLYKTSSQLIGNASLYATGNIIVPYKSWLIQLF